MNSNEPQTASNPLLGKMLGKFGAMEMQALGSFRDVTPVSSLS